MTMTPRLRKFVLTAHITFSVGWLGAVVAYLALAVAGLISHDVSMVRAAYLSMELLGWFVIVPFSLAALLTGLVQSLGTPWGLFRHYWILVKFLLTTAATIVLLRHLPAVSRMSGVAAETSPYWRTLIDNGSVAVVWNSDLKPDPKDNASLLLTYNNAGLFSKLGRVWVCWGDLRTEYASDAALQAQESVALTGECVLNRRGVSLLRAWAIGS